jgi:hypothetical protein
MSEEKSVSDDGRANALPDPIYKNFSTRFGNGRNQQSANNLGFKNNSVFFCS